MATLPGCPTELLDSILRQVSISDLTAVSLASKKLYEFATPLLYSQIDFSIHRDNPRPLLRLSRSIFNKPKLGAFVKSVHLRDGEPKIQDLHKGSWRHQDDTPKPCPPQLTDEDGISDLVAFIASSGLSYADLWIEKLRSGDLNAVVAQLLSNLPNLASFRVGYAVVLPYLETTKFERVPPKTAGENQFLGKIFQSAVFDPSNHGLSRFEHLKDISFPGPMDTDPGRNPDFCNPRDMMALLSLPSIRSIKGWCLNPGSLPFTWPATPPDLTHLTSLSLSFVHVDFLAQVLERTRALKCLSWEWKYVPQVDPLNTDTIDLNRFVEALKPVQDTLEDLTISATSNVAWDHYDFPAIHVQGSLNGLGGFVNIKQFKVPFGLLLPDWEIDENPARRLEDSMPPNVEVVTVTDGTMPEAYAYNEHDEMNKLRSWIVDTSSTRTPRLVEICFYLVRGSNWIEYEQYDRFEQVFEGSKLKHRIIKQDDEEPWENV
ncbi:hypothetical protein PMIN06_012521 [Paraphaeosphaeria minitans]|uniref:F-box domain protein n=1 Tax=Paraphaeosphaeria minitans TaxID=565426 RepID=A0A9P6GNA7_9PLEO|nr:F-box domain protein [Paraphaeosphaeria minitans]